MVPENLYYTEEHEWIRIEDGQATLGITDHAQKELGDITYVELPDIDDEFDSGDDIAVVESVKAAADVYAPLNGIITEVNEGLEDEPELVNASPYEKGWICKFSDFDENDLEDLMSPQQYKDFIEG